MMKQLVLLVVITLFITATPPDAPIPASQLVKMIGQGSSYDFGINDSLGNKVGGFNWAKYTENTLDDILLHTDGGGRIRIGHPAPPYAIDPTTFQWSQFVLDSIERIVDDFIARGIPIGISLGEPDMIEWYDTAYPAMSYEEKLINAGVNQWIKLAEYFKDKSHLLFFELFIEYQGGKDVFSRDSCDTLYWQMLDTLTQEIRKTNPTRILAYKPWGVGRTGLEKMPFPFGDDADDPQNGYYLGSFGGIASGGPDIDSNDVFSYEEKEKTLERAILPNARFRDSTTIPIWAGVWGYLTAMTNTPPKKPKSIEFEYLDWYMQYLAQYEISGAYSQMRAYYPQKDGGGWNDTVASIFDKHLWKDKTIWYDNYLYPITVSSDTMENLNVENTGKLLSHSLNGGKIIVNFTDTLVDSIRIKRVFTSTNEQGESIEFWQMIKVATPDKWPTPATSTEYVLNNPTPVMGLITSATSNVQISVTAHRIQLGSLEKFSEVVLYTLSGREVLRQNIAGRKSISLATENLSRGTYLIRIFNKNMAVSQRVVLQ